MTADELTAELGTAAAHELKSALERIKHCLGGCASDAPTPCRAFSWDIPSSHFSLGGATMLSLRFQWPWREARSGGGRGGRQCRAIRREGCALHVFLPINRATSVPVLGALKRTRLPCSLDAKRPPSAAFAVSYKLSFFSSYVCILGGP